MKRIIPRNVKVSTEFFQGVSLTDILVGFFGVVVVALILLSTLPGRFWIGLVLGLIFLYLLLRLDEPNYMMLFRILQHYSYVRRYRKMSLPEPELREDDSYEYAQRTVLNNVVSPAEKEEAEEFDTAIPAPAEGEPREAILNYLFDPENPVQKEMAKKPPLEKLKSRRKEAKASREQARDRRKVQKSENKLLKRKDVPEQEKDLIRVRRKRQAEIQYYNAQVTEQYKHRVDIRKMFGVTAINDGFISYHENYFGAAIEIPAVEFRFFSEHRRQNSINNALGSVVRMASPTYSTNLVKVEQPLILDEHIEAEYDKIEMLRTSFENGMLNEDELKARVELIYSRIDHLETLNAESKVLTPHYYMVFFGSDKRQLSNQVSNALRTLESGEMHPRRLNDKELAVFLRYTNSVDFDEREINDLSPEEYVNFILPDSLEIKPRTTQVNGIITHNFRVSKYPLLVDDAWAATLFDSPGTKVMVKFSQMDQEKSIRAIDRSISELQSRLEKTNVSSRVLELQTHIDTLQELLTTLNNSNESLIAANIYVTAYDINATRNNTKLVPQPELSILPSISNMKKVIRRTFVDQGFRLSDLLFQQFDGFVATQVNGYDPMLKQSRGMPGSTVAAMFPWIFASLDDPRGVSLGSSDNVPTFIDFFRRDNERVNSNVVVVGKSGGGKSYAVKSMLANLAADDSKIFVLDPENEYTELADNLNGKFINVANSSSGRINPFHILTTLEDDDMEAGQESSSYAAHLQFLEEFFRQILPEVNSDAMEYLNNLVNRVYAQHGIDQYTNLTNLRAEDYPTFDDLYDCVLEEFMHSDSNYIRSNLRVLVNYIAKFSTGGRNAVIWNGPSTLSTIENFIVFNFQSLLANRNNTIANAQMLLVLKYLDNEIIKNRDYNLKHHANRRIIVVIDEAHVFIDSKYPLALDFMYQLAKRIRKYNGMQIVITQNIKDFVGSEELARKSTAIINACQYSFIFSLAPNDMTDLCTLYDKAGGINESEQEQIINAGRGQAFVVTGPGSRSSMQIETPEQIETMFSQAGFMQNLYTDKEDQAHWEEFIGDSRALRAASLLEMEDSEANVPEDVVPILQHNTDVELIVEEPSQEEEVVLLTEDEDEGDELLSVPEPTFTIEERQNATERTLAALQEVEKPTGYFGPLSPQGLQQFGLDALVNEIHKKVEAELIQKYGLSPVANGAVSSEAPSVPVEPAPETMFEAAAPADTAPAAQPAAPADNQPGAVRSVPDSAPAEAAVETSSPVVETAPAEEKAEPVVSKPSSEGNEATDMASPAKPAAPVRMVRLDELGAADDESDGILPLSGAAETAAVSPTPETSPVPEEAPASEAAPVPEAPAEETPAAPPPKVRRITLADLIKMQQQ